MIQHYNNCKVNICVKFNTVTGYHDKIIDTAPIFTILIGKQWKLRKLHRSMHCLSNSVLLRQDNNIIRTFISSLKKILKTYECSYHMNSNLVV